MSELNATLLRQLAEAIMQAGSVDRDRAVHLAAINATMPLIEGDTWVVLDDEGQPVLSLPIPDPLIA